MRIKGNWILAGFLLISGPGFATEELTPDEQEYAETMIIYPDPEQDWLFGFHNTISDSVFGTAQWFDKFFATDEAEEISPKALARIRLGYEPRARNFDVFTQKFRLRLKLPHLEDKVDLLLSDDDDDGSDVNKQGGGRVANRDKDEDTFTAALRLINVDNIGEFVDTRIGISGGDIFVKSRAKITYDFGTKHQLEIQPSIYYYIDDGFGSRFFTEYDYNFAEKRQFRANYSIRTSESFNGYRWRNGYHYLYQIDRYRATSLGVVINGENNGDRGFLVDNYLLNYRFRMNAYRRWLFFEIEPFVEWPEEEDYKATPGIAFRIEGYFEKKPD
ncbi:hypothetical protein E2K93_06990 [Thalassotalea sp. HSM 43]|uniref:hypothetical protein n=1 Tax=Thalassotalea sp. HSM 43 TaxID=2552945 RepID=UPI00108188F2|nr:hypothetical protein [Thalassotalea sp. HSM 43]QBY04146.1 hypothetical protein E2K93_06990 [Thalassotalea sp. HSM 43]